MRATQRSEAMNEVEKKSNFLGLIVLFVVLTVVGVVLSYFYIVFQVRIHDIWGNIVANFVLGLIFAVTVFAVKRLFKITNNAMSVVVVILSLVVILWAMWTLWFVLMERMLYHHMNLSVFGDMGRFVGWSRAQISSSTSFWDLLTYYNARGTWTLEGSNWVGLRLWGVWAGEALIITIPPLIAAYMAAGLYLIELNAWVTEKLMNYGFTAFDDYEMDRLASGDINVVLEKQLETQGGPMNAVAVCYHKNEPTDFLAVYKATWDKDGILAKGRHLMTVKLDQDKIDRLDTELQAKHFPDNADEYIDTDDTPADDTKDTSQAKDEATTGSVEATASEKVADTPPTNNEQPTVDKEAAAEDKTEQSGEEPKDE